MYVHKRNQQETEGECAPDNLNIHRAKHNKTDDRIIKTNERADEEARRQRRESEETQVADDE